MDEQEVIARQAVKLERPGKLIECLKCPKCGASKGT